MEELTCTSNVNTEASFNGPRLGRWEAKRKWEERRGNQRILKDRDPTWVIQRPKNESRLNDMVPMLKRGGHRSTDT